MADPNVVKLFHFGRFDMAVLAHAFGVMAGPVYCTKIASKLARTYTDRHGLKDLTRELLSVEVSKQQQSSDWGAETLTDAQLAYAASDVLHLHALREKLDTMLMREGRDSLARAAFAYLPDRVRLDLAGFADMDSSRTAIPEPDQPIAAFCRPTSRPMPTRASAIICSSSASLNGAPSAEPCTSTSPPDPVMTKFASVSAVESSA